MNDNRLLINKLKIKRELLFGELKRDYERSIDHKFHFDIIVQTHLLCEHMCGIITEFSARALEVSEIDEKIEKLQGETWMPKWRACNATMQGLMKSGRIKSEEQNEKAAAFLTKIENKLTIDNSSQSTIAQNNQATIDGDEMGLSDTQKRLLQNIYNHFRESATWPTYRAMEIEFREKRPFHEIVMSIDRRLIRVEDIYREDAVCYLTLEGLAHCDGAAKDIQAIINTAALFAKRYIEKKGSANITSGEIKSELGLGEIEMQRVCEMYWRFGWLTGGGSRSNEGKSSNFTISRNALLFDGVMTLDDFYTRIKNAEKKDEAERRLNAPVDMPSSATDLLNVAYSLPTHNNDLGSPQGKGHNRPKPFYKTWQWGVLIALLGVFVAALTPLKNIYDAQPKIHVRTQILISGFRENGYPIGRVFAVFKNTGSSMVTLEPMVSLSVFDKNGKSTREGYLMFRFLPFNPSNPGKSIPGEPQAIQPGEEVSAENALMDLSEISEPIGHVEIKFTTIKGQKCYADVPLSTYFSSSKIQVKPGVQYGPTAGAKSDCQWSF